MKKKTILTVLFLLCFSVEVFAENPIKQLFKQGILALKREQYQKAVSLFEKTVAIAPEFAPAYNYLGICHRSLGTKSDDVIWMFEQAVKFNPEYPEAWDSLSRLYYADGRFEDAKNASLMALKVKPDMLSSKLSLAWVYLLGFSDAQSAVDIFADILENYDLPYAQFGLGMAHFIDGEKFKALEMITELKNMGQKGLAKQLENLVRAGYSKLPEIKPGQPLFRTKIQMQQPFNAAFMDKLQEVREERDFDMKVRLKGEDREAPAASSIPLVDISISPAERIRQLQQKGLSQ